MYAEELENAILSKVRNLSQNPHAHPLDKYKKNNDGSYRAFEVDRIGYPVITKKPRLGFYGLDIQAEGRPHFELS